jgi:DNA polymerase I-like protein with 3'-5' exonuclease and polymerase domains
LIYADWSQQEAAIAAILSKDEKMLEAYESPDFYLHLAILAGKVPKTATKYTHILERNKYKVMSLAIQYGAGLNNLCDNLGLSRLEAAELRHDHYVTFHKYWRWIRETISYAKHVGYLRTKLGWVHLVNKTTRPSSIQNWPMQANAAEMLRIAVHHMLINGIKVCATIHDAVLVECFTGQLEDTKHDIQTCMNLASQQILDGYILRADHYVVPEGENYVDEDGIEFWKKVKGYFDGE